MRVEGSSETAAQPGALGSECVKRVLVTGASGFIGRHTLEPLLAAGAEVHAVSARDAPLDVPAGVRWHRADLLAHGAARELIRRLQPSHLLHLAWYARPGSNLTAGVNIDWVHASMRLLDAFGEAGGDRAVFAGSCAEYTWEPRTHCMEGATPTDPATLYGLAKHRLHTMAAELAPQMGVSLAWARIFFVYGPHEQHERLAAAVARALLRGEEVACSHGRQIRDFLYAPELGSALTALLRSDVTGPVNVASGAPVRVADLIDAIAAAAGRPELVRLGAKPAVRGEPDRLTAEVKRLREEVGWSSSVGLQEGAARTVGWWRRRL
jgi:nucleoside-diphosphate-sugar epimerase